MKIEAQSIATNISKIIVQKKESEQLIQTSSASFVKSLVGLPIFLICLYFPRNNIFFFKNELIQSIYVMFNNSSLVRFRAILCCCCLPLFCNRYWRKLRIFAYNGEWWFATFVQRFVALRSIASRPLNSDQTVVLNRLEKWISEKRPQVRNRNCFQISTFSPWIIYLSRIICRTISLSNG